MPDNEQAHSRDSIPPSPEAAPPAHADAAPVQPPLQVRFFSAPKLNRAFAFLSKRLAAAEAALRPRLAAVARDTKRFYAENREALTRAGLPAAILLGVVLLYSLYWSIAAGEMRRTLDRFVAEQRAAGLSFDYEALRVGGFPFRLSAVFRELKIGNSAVAADWIWTTERAEIVAMPWDFNHVNFYLPSPQDFTFQPPGHAPGMGLERRGYRLEPSALRASVRMQGGRLARASLHLDGAKLAGRRLFEGLEDVPMGGFACDLFELHLREAPVTAAAGEAKPGADIVIRLQGLGWDGRGPLALPPAIERFDFSGRLEDLPDIGLLSEGARGIALFLGAWADRQGALDVQGLDLSWGDLGLSAQGRLHPQADGTVSGTLAAALAGYGRTLDGAVAAGAIEPRQADGLKSMIDLVDRSDATPADGRAEAELRFESGALYLGSTKLADLPRLF